MSKCSLSLSLSLSPPGWELKKFAAFSSSHTLDFKFYFPNLPTEWIWSSVERRSSSVRWLACFLLEQTARLGPPAPRNSEAKPSSPTEHSHAITPTICLTLPIISTNSQVGVFGSGFDLAINNLTFCYDTFLQSMECFKKKKKKKVSRLQPLIKRETDKKW